MLLEDSGGLSDLEKVPMATELVSGNPVRNGTLIEILLDCGRLLMPSIRVGTLSCS